MAKQLNKKDIIIIHAEAEEKFLLLKHVLITINDLEAKAEAEMAEVTARYSGFVDALNRDKTNLEKDLLSLMKKNKSVIFTGTDVVDLPHGSLIRNAGDKVTIPRNALDACKANGFKDVIKVVESLDRDAIEKWPDAKLVLIGAARKTVEEFKYTLKDKA